MKCKHVLFLSVVTFIWIWSLPIIIIGSMFLIPGCCFVCTLTMCLGMYVQYKERRSVTPDHWLRRFVADLALYEWFPCNTLHFETGMIACGPHGILCCGTLAGIHFVRGSKTCMCIAPIVFYVPIVGILARKLGCIPADVHHMKLALQLGLPVLVVPGGVPEIVMMEAHDDQLRFKRHGFLRIAAEMEVPVYAVHVQGECNTYKLYRGPFFDTRVYLSWLLNIPLVMPLMFGYYGTCIPKRTPLKLFSCEINDYKACKYQLQVHKLMTKHSD